MKKHLDDLTEIRSIMERSSRFISLSGLSGIFAGSFALIGAYLAYLRILAENNRSLSQNFFTSIRIDIFLFIIAIVVLGLSLIFSIYFSARKAKKNGVSIWNNASRRLVTNTLLPLAAGGLFCLILLNNAPQMIAPATLIFYGLALVTASKYTFDNVKYLGYVEIGLGLACGLINDWTLRLLFWAMGFGVCHIIYGIVMYREHKD